MNEPIAVSKELEEMFKSKNVEITFYPDKVTKKFKTFRSFYTCINEETEFWLKYRNDTNLSNIYGQFTYVLNALNMALSSSSPQTIEGHLVNAINSANNQAFPSVYSFTSAGSKIVSMVIQKVDAQIIQGFRLFLESGVLNPGNKGLLLGGMEAYKTLYPFSSSEEIKEQANGLNALKETLLRETEEFRSRYETTSNSIEDEYKIFTDTMRNWKDEEESSYQQFRNERASELKNLEETYREKLKLEAPVQYWIDSKVDYAKKGKNWRRWTVITAAVIIMLLIPILYNLPYELSGNLSSFNFNSIQSTLILAVIVSVGIYLMRLFAKLSISAFHLSRDAAEREKLTYLYLSLSKDNQIAETERSIVLQALFSRADTGLLKGDSSPSFPDGMLQQVFKLINK